MKYFLVTQTVYNIYKIPAKTKTEALRIFLEKDSDLPDYLIKSEEGSEVGTEIVVEKELNF